MTPRAHHPRQPAAAPASSATRAPRPDVSPLLDAVTELAMAVVGGTVCYINRPGLALLGYSGDEQVLGKRLETIIDPRTLHTLLLRRQGSGDPAKGAWVRAPLKRGNGSNVDCELRVSTMATAGDGLMLVGRQADVTSVLADDAPAAALHAAQGLKNLITNMAHELRTPLNAIIGFSEIIAERMFGDLNDRYAAYAGDIMASGQHLLRIINDILDYAKVEAGEMTLRPEGVSVNDIVRQSLRLVTAQAEQAGLQLVNELSDIPRLYLDPTKIKQIVVNLLSNAIKFTPRGGQVRVGSRLLDDEVVEICVADNGVGMTEAEIAEAVLPFRQPRRPPDGSYTGTGLGLPIAKALVSLHGGELQILSKPKVGTQVRFTLRAQQAATSAMSLGK